MSTLPSTREDNLARRGEASPKSNTSANLVALHTIVRREIVRIMRIWTQTLIPPAITMTLYFVIFGKLIGSRIGSMHGFTYMQYIVPGLVMMSIITNSYGNITSSFFGAKFGRYVEEMLVSPMPNWVILSGYIIGAMVRGLCVGVVVMLIALLFTDLHMMHPLVTVTTAMLTSIVFALAGFANSVFARKFDDIALVPTFVLTPLTYLGGVFYSIDQIGEPWHTISLANPILYMVNAFRFGVLGVSDIPVGTAYAVMVLFVLLLGAFGIFLLKRGIGMRS
jgi:ABC-2 type transport system permease protein